MGSKTVHGAIGFFRTKEPTGFEFPPVDPVGVFRRDEEWIDGPVASQGVRCSP
jgi:hypothetical protein